MTNKLRLLVVEDEPEINEILVSTFDEQNIEVHSATNGAQALELIKKIRFDAVLSDIAMPIMDGLSLLSAARGISLDLPFVMLTAFGEREKIFEALRLGAHDFLDKPFEVKNVIPVVLMSLEIGYKRRVILENLEKLAQSGQPEGAAALSAIQDLQKIAFFKSVNSFHK
jgi:DNA-binding NtrC family response regulator